MQKLQVKDLDEIARSTRQALSLPAGAGRARLWVHMGTCGISAGARAVASTVERCLAESGLGGVQLRTTGCAGLCSREPMMTVELAGHRPVVYADLTAAKAREIFERHVVGGQVAEEYALAEGREQSAEDLLGSVPDPGPSTQLPQIGELGFFQKQHLIALRNRGLIDPEKIEEYIARGGYRGLAKAVTAMSPQQIIDEIKRSGLRGRGGAGYPTGRKWESAARHASDVKYIICNADEGDPGAFMDRSIIEADPHAVIEGMVIAGLAVGSRRGIVYIRTEYPLALERLHLAIAQARERGLLGQDILGHGAAFDIEVFRGAGAFVCGESSALRASIQGDPPEPSAKHVHATERGLFQQPTVLNNVETLATVPEIIVRGADWFAGIGTEHSKGTKVFALTGKVQNTGLVEVPMGTPLREIIFDIGGGIEAGRQFKAVQTGGPSGGCIPASLLDLPVDYERLSEVGSMMGSGGMIVMDDGTCMVDVARYFLDFLRDESCGKCVACREGVDAMYRIVSAICEGRGQPSDIETLQDLGETILDTALCGLGNSAPYPVLSTLRYFRDEYEAHIQQHRCPAGVCKALITYSIDAAKCNGCTLCVKNCPADAIRGEKKKPHVVDAAKCIKCGICVDVCKREAMVVQ